MAPIHRLRLRPAQRAVETLALIALFAAGCGGTDAAPVVPGPAQSGVPVFSGDRPNVLIVVIDCLRADHVGTYGYSLATTPVLDQLAETSLVFERAYAPASWTMPSHAAMFTGYVGALQQLPEEQGLAITPWTPTLAGALGAAGYRTGFFGDAPVMRVWPSMARGFQDAMISLPDTVPTPHESRFTRGEMWPMLPGAATPPGFSTRPTVDGGFPDAPVAHAGNQARDSSFFRTVPAFLDWAGQEPEASFFAYLHGNDVHFPYECSGSQEFVSDSAVPLDGDDVTRRIQSVQASRRAQNVQISLSEREVQDVLSDGERATLVARYDSCVRFSDDWIAELIKGLQERELWDNTLVIVTADHGESLGEGGMYGHGSLLNSVSLGEEILRVPLVLSLPSQGLSGRREDPVSLVDLYPTILEAAGVPVSDSDGRSLWRAPPDGVERRFLARGSKESAEPERPQTGTPDHFAVMQGEWKVTTIYGETFTSKLRPPFRERRMTGSKADEIAHQLLEEIRVPQITGPRSRPRPAETHPDDRPLNLVLLDVPGLRLDRLVGGDGPPALMRLAKESVTFERATAASYWTLPAITSLFTGKHACSHGVLSRNDVLPDGDWTLAEVLSAHGFRTAAWTGGLDTAAHFGIDQGFGAYLDAPTDEIRTLRQTVPEAVAWMSEKTDEPFFVFLSGYDLHAPWHPPTGSPQIGAHGVDCTSLDAQWLARWRGQEGATTLPDGTVLEVDQLRDVVQSCYDLCLDSLDVAVGEVVDGLGQLGLLDSTVVIVTADHGEALGERGHYTRFHAQEMRPEITRVPLMIRLPGGVGRSEDSWIGTVDIMPTALELLDIEPPAGCEGRSAAWAFTLDADESPGGTRGALSVRSRNSVVFYSDDGVLTVDLPGPLQLDSLDGEAIADPEIRWAAMRRLSDFAREQRLTVRETGGPVRHIDKELRDLLRRYGYWDLAGEDTP